MLVLMCVCGFKFNRSALRVDTSTKLNGTPQSDDHGTASASAVAGALSSPAGTLSSTRPLIAGALPAGARSVGANGVATGAKDPFATPTTTAAAPNGSALTQSAQLAQINQKLDYLRTYCVRLDQRVGVMTCRSPSALAAGVREADVIRTIVAGEVEKAKVSNAQLLFVGGSIRPHLVTVNVCGGFETCAGTYPDQDCKATARGISVECSGCPAARTRYWCTTWYCPCELGLEWGHGTTLYAATAFAS